MKINVAVVQQAIASNDKKANWQASEEKVRSLAQSGVQLILLQELHAGLYFCQHESPDNFELSEPLGGETFKRCEALAQELDIVIVMSQFERRAAGLYHNTAQVLDGKMGLVGTYRKMHIPDDPGFYEKYYFTPGDAVGPYNGFAPIETRIGKLGVLVCWDQWYPEAARLMALAGADLLLYPTAIGWDPDDSNEEKQRQREAWITIQRSHAIANGIPVLVANRTGYEPSPQGIIRNNNNQQQGNAQNCDAGIQFWGSSFIAGPQGELLVMAPEDQEGAYSASIDLLNTEKIRRAWPYFRDRRIDAYQGLTKRWLDNSC